MTDITLISPMSEAEARETVNRIRRHLGEAEYHDNAARKHALELHEREGWKALGYPSLRQCFIAELGTSWQHGYRLIAAAEVDQNLSDYSPIGETFSIPETHARQLHKLPAPKQIVAYDRAQTLANTEGAKTVTARHVEAAVATIEAEIAIQDNPVIAHAVAAGEITPADGVKIHNALCSLPPQHQANVMTLMTEHGLRDAALVVPLAEMSTRPADRLSKTFEEIARTGHVAGVPLAQATLTDLKKLRDAAQQEHISDAVEQKRMQQIETGVPVQEPVIITVYRNAPHKTYKALAQALSYEDLAVLSDLIANHGGWKE